MIEKWERQPFRVGLVLGFVALPLLWFLQEYALRLLTRHLSPSREEIAFYFQVGALPGAMLGAGLSQAVAAYRQSESGVCRWHLLWHGGWIAALALTVTYWIFSHGQAGSKLKVTFLSTPLPDAMVFFFDSIFYRDFVLHCALLMFIAGIFVRSRR